jgi:aquaporin Z
MPTTPTLRVAVAEAIGTMILIIGGPGAAILATGSFFPEGSIGALGVALAFGLSLLVAAYAIGPITGCHINPAVTFGLWLAGKVDTALVPAYVVGQVVGAFLGALFLRLLIGGHDAFELGVDKFAANGWDKLSPGGFGFWAMVAIEVLMTAILVFVVLSTTQKGYDATVVGLHVGLTLALIHLISIPVDNTSVNPVRSFATAIFAGSDALKQLWAFVVFPLVGAAVGWLAHGALHQNEAPIEVPAEAKVG